ncbi:hypothetical protein QJS10_CPB04g00348 [Acorus calamus]|uniref:Uncharacterized protein n=1 Tax=Acorus calamus TaxID=4465 RepID=A0AAV9EXW8_ACOCL|nr:hypothetical protein QJS10_CPB04g00348 [Acorus calamus]
MAALRSLTSTAPPSQPLVFSKTSYSATQSLIFGDLANRRFGRCHRRQARRERLVSRRGGRSWVSVKAVLDFEGVADVETKRQKESKTLEIA